MKRDLGDGYELDDDSARIDRDAVHRYLCEESYWAKGRSRDVQDELIESAPEAIASYARSVVPVDRYVEGGDKVRVKVRALVR